MTRFQFIGFRQKPLWLLLTALLLAFWASPTFACDVATPTTADLGSASPAAIKASAPFVRAGGGFKCTGFTILTLLSSNYLKGTIASGTVLKLTSAASPADTVSYKLYADANGTMELKAGTVAYYMNGSVLNLLNLLGNGTIDAPIYVKTSSSSFVAPGTYTGSFSIKWEWNFCNGIAALGLCVGVTDSGAKTAVVNVVLIVANNPPTISVGFGPMTWDTINGTNSPKALPGGKRRVIVTISNPDVVATEANALQIIVPTPPHMAIALDGDGTGSGAVIQPSEGATASGLTLTYGGPSSSSDHVDFSNDGGRSWSYLPTAGSGTSQANVSTVRFRPQGTMAPQSSYTISLPYSVK